MVLVFAIMHLHKIFIFHIGSAHSFLNQNLDKSGIHNLDGRVVDNSTSYPYDYDDDDDVHFYCT